MNILTSSLPSAVLLRGKSYRIKTDFKTWILIGDLLEKGGSFAAAATLCYIDLPEEASLAAEGIRYFYSRGEKLKGGGEKLLSFAEDADYIYSAFLTQYSIDLCDVSLHWWKFISLLRGLDDNLKLSQLMSIRACNPADIKDSRLRERLYKLKRRHSLSKHTDLGEAF